MEIYHITHNIKVFGNVVETFPNGVGEAFHELIEKIPGGRERVYYGISWCIGNDITYIAAAEQKSEEEASKYNCDSYTIEKGDYLCIAVDNWQSKVDCIKDFFAEIIKDERADNKTPAIEIYKNDKEMLCIVALKRSLETLDEFADTYKAFLNAAKAFDEEEINQVPFEDSWTAAQVLVHVTKSNYGIAKAMKLEGTTVSRDADARVPELRKTFLDYTVKFKSPEFIIPPGGPHDRNRVIADFENSVEQLKEASKTTHLSEAIKHPAFGEITKLELLHFVLFHMQRHTRQLRNIMSHIKREQFSNN